jgi:hypothetical protein
LVPFNLERVILALDVRLRTPSPLLPINNEPWQSQTPSNTLELGSQSTLVKARIQRHIDSLPTSMVEAFEKVLKGGSDYRAQASVGAKGDCRASSGK